MSNFSGNYNVQTYDWDLVIIFTDAPAPEGETHYIPDIDAITGNINGKHYYGEDIDGEMVAVFTVGKI